MSSNRTRFRVFSLREGTPCATIVGIFFVQKGGRISSQQTKVLVVAKWLSHCYSPRSLCAYRRSCPRAPPAEGKTPEKTAVKSQVTKNGQRWAWKITYIKTQPPGAQIPVVKQCCKVFFQAKRSVDRALRTYIFLFVMTCRVFFWKLTEMCKDNFFSAEAQEYSTSGSLHGRHV